MQPCYQTIQSLYLFKIPESRFPKITPAAGLTVLVVAVQTSLVNWTRVGTTYAALELPWVSILDFFYLHHITVNLHMSIGVACQKE